MDRSFEHSQQTADKKKDSIRTNEHNENDDNNYDTAVITSNFMTINSIDSSHSILLSIGKVLRNVFLCECIASGNWR